MREQNKVQWVYSSKSNEELLERYDQWASDYDKDLFGDFSYRTPQMAAEVFVRHVPKDARILDAGAGTGIVGEVLTGMGYRNLTAIDLSQGMLAEAARKNVYAELRQMVLGELLDFSTDSFDAVICVGTLTVAHAPATSLDEFARITRPGGHISFTLRPDTYEQDGFKEKQAELEAAGRWELVEVTEPFQGIPKGEPDIYLQVWLYRVLCS